MKKVSGRKIERRARVEEVDEVQREADGLLTSLLRL